MIFHFSISGDIETDNCNKQEIKELLEAFTDSWEYEGDWVRTFIKVDKK